MSNHRREVGTLRKKNTRIIIGIFIVVVLAVSVFLLVKSSLKPTTPFSVTLLHCDTDVCDVIKTDKFFALYSENGGPSSDVTHIWLDATADATTSDVTFNNFQINPDTGTDPTTITGSPGPITASDLYTFFKNKQISPIVKAPISKIATWSTRYFSDADTNLGCITNADCDAGTTVIEECKTISGEPAKRCVINIQPFEGKCSPCQWQVGLKGIYTIGSNQLTKSTTKTISFVVGQQAVSSLYAEVSRGT